MNLKNALCALIVFFSSTLSLSAAPRVWTSADGRKIAAEYLGRNGAGDLVLQRVDGGGRVAVAIATLSPEDQVHAAGLGMDLAVDDSAQDKPKKKAPSPAVLEMARAWTEPEFSSASYPAWNRQHPDFVDLRRRFDRELANLLSGDVAMNCRSLKIKAEREASKLEGESQTTGPSSGQNNARKWAAQLGAYWLRQSVIPQLARIEAEASK